MTTRYHKAAQDGMLDILKEANKRDCNTKDEDGMTPTLWAAFQGNLDALRLLVGRGGNPEKVNFHFGQTALHIAAGKGHMNCVSFLVGFGVNLWALDHEAHTPMQVAAMHNRREILEYLDKACAKQEATNKREVKIKKEKALKDAEKHKKKYEEKVKKERDKEERRIKKVEKEYLDGHKLDLDKPVSNSIPIRRMRTGSDASVPTFTQLVGTGAAQATGTAAVMASVVGTLTKKPGVPTTGVKKILDRKLRAGSHNKQVQDEDINTAQMPPNQRTDAQIIYVNSYESQSNGKRGRLSDVFDTKGELFRCVSQPEYLNASGATMAEQSSIFDRPGFGSVAFRQRNALVEPLNNIPRSESDWLGSVITTKEQDVVLASHCNEELSGGAGGVGGEDSSIGSAGSLAKRNQPHAHVPWHQQQLTSSDEEDGGVAEGPWSPLQRFLIAAGVAEYTPQFIQQRIDLEALLMLSDQDLVTLCIPMGPRRKLLNAVQERKKAIEDPGEIQDSKL